MYQIVFKAVLASSGIVLFSASGRCLVPFQSQVDQLDLLAKAVVFDAFTVGSAKEAFTMMGHGEMREDALTVRGKYDLQKKCKRLRST